MMQTKGAGGKGRAYKVCPSFFIFNIIYLLTPNHQCTQMMTPTPFNAPTTASACAEHNRWVRFLCSVPFQASYSTEHNKTRPSGRVLSCSVPLPLWVMSHHTRRTR